MYKAASVLLVCVSLLICFGFLSSLSVSLDHQSRNQTASVFFEDSVTELSLKDKYRAATRSNDKKVRILIVPGHDKESWGTQFNGLKELDLNLEVADKLYKLLSQEKNFDVRLSQTVSGYSPVFSSYFENNREGILKFIGDQKGLMEHYISAGKITRSVGVVHNNAATETAIKLYGINKWANENKMDVVIHIHFNDYPGRKMTQPGKYSGFAIYVPDSQYSNAKGSKSIAEAIHERLSTFYAQSNLPIEDGGEDDEDVIEDQELIALGSNNTLDGAGILIEYGYIYEPTFTEAKLRSLMLSDLAQQTYLGIMDFFKNTSVQKTKVESVLIPHEWHEDLEKGDEANPDVARLQAALMLEGVYPPPGKEKNDCGITGYFGPCTELSVKAFQEKHGIEPAQGFVGELTRRKLNEIY